ncbi:hypothetical protein [Flavobacterium aestivum]|uniref:hypothetical protein n=1 Tax=Flavobacterium aestivum TaxID=3003257 RepID=UPI0022861C2E|nr:hypothetical protein [Flavobacterium aestivum]
MLMDKTTFEEYKSAIKAQYRAQKTDSIYGSTPAQLRDLCLNIFENRLTKSDENIFRSYFGAKEDEKLGRAIENFGTGRLKSVISFLKGEKDSGNKIRVELAAIVIDFELRPLSKYSQYKGTTDIISIEIPTGKEQNVTVDSIDDLEEFTGNEVIIEDNIKNKKLIRKIIPFLTGFLFLFFMMYTIKDIISPTKQCMQWKGNHYEAVDCTNEKLGIGQLNNIVPIDENTMELRKLDPKAALVFFKNGKALVWYSKNDGEIELFNQPGFNPETDKPLKAITNYIIKSHRLKEKE